MPRKWLRSAARLTSVRGRIFMVLSLVALLVGVARLSGGGSQAQAQAARAGIARGSSSASTGSTASSTTAPSFGPHTGGGTFNGTSPAVNDLPVLPTAPITSVTARDNENLHPNATTSDAKDPVVQNKKGTGAISDPIANFDGICLPFGPPCDQASGCGCLPPDTDGEVGATQYVQMVNSDFAVYSKTGSVLRGATPINQLWAGTDSECAGHNDGDPVV